MEGDELSMRVMADRLTCYLEKMGEDSRISLDLCSYAPDKERCVIFENDPVEVDGKEGVVQVDDGKWTVKFDDGDVQPLKDVVRRLRVTQSFLHEIVKEMSKEKEQSDEDRS